MRTLDVIIKSNNNISNILWNCSYVPEVKTLRAKHKHYITVTLWPVFTKNGYKPRPQCVDNVPGFARARDDGPAVTLTATLYNVKIVCHQMTTSSTNKALKAETDSP